MSGEDRVDKIKSIEPRGNLFEKTVEEATEVQTNLEKTTEIEINPDPQDITEEEMKNIGQ